MSEILMEMGISLAYLHKLPRGARGRGWPNAWQVDAKILFLAGWSCPDIAAALGGPYHRTIMRWAVAGGWHEERGAHKKAVADLALAEIVETQAAVTVRNLKDIRAVGSMAMKAAIDGSVEAKSLEGVVAAVVAAIKMEREILGLEHMPEVKVEDHRTQVIISEMNSLAPGQLKAYFAEMRKKLEAETAIKKLVSASVIEGEVSEVVEGDVVEGEVVDGGEPDGPETPG